MAAAVEQRYPPKLGTPKATDELQIDAETARNLAFGPRRPRQGPPVDWPAVIRR